MLADSPSAQTLNSFQFTFEAYLDHASRIEPDPNPTEYDSHSLSDSIGRFQEEFGRTYHSYRAGSYHFPNDPTENERQEEQFEILKIVMDKRNYLSPFSASDPPRKVLDLATGTGTWAIEMGDEFPDAQIIGTDLSPIQPPFVPPNVRFYVEDSTEDWDFATDFDFIHTRITIGCWSDMKTQVVQRAFEHLKPGGWFEMQEVDIVPTSDDGTITDDFPWRRWAHDLIAAGKYANRQLNLGGEPLAAWLREAGFEDVHEVVFKIPINGWPRDTFLKHVGMLWQRTLMIGVSGFSLSLFHHYLGKTVEEIEVSLVDVRRCLFDQKVHGHMNFVVVYGRKPETSAFGV